MQKMTGLFVIAKCSHGIDFGPEKRIFLKKTGLTQSRTTQAAHSLFVRSA